MNRIRDLREDMDLRQLDVIDVYIILLYNQNRYYNISTERKV